jgi:charged multivesicular body protein 1
MNVVKGMDQAMKAMDLEKVQLSFPTYLTSSYADGTN